MYHYLGAGESLPPEAYSQIPNGAIRLHAHEQDIISRKLTDNEIASIGSNVKMNIVLTAACDNYDRLAGVNLVLVPKGSTSYTYNQADIKRIEIGRFITPFMNKNISPTQVPYSYQVDNISNICMTLRLHPFMIFMNSEQTAILLLLKRKYRAGRQNRCFPWKSGICDQRNRNIIITEFLLPLSYRQNLNNYNATDVPGQTTRIVNFTLDQPVQNAVLYLVTSNHGSNSGGEEYVRRQHFVYLDNLLIHEYKPGGKTCEDYRQYNTQGNGIYGTTVKPLRNWMNWNNWCPGDAVPNREVMLGNLAVGSHSIKIDVPDAVFKDGQGYFPISMYIQNQKSGQIICAAPTQFQITSQVGQEINISWKENGNANQWETIWSRKTYIHQIMKIFIRYQIPP
jgi:hypothetical protein